MKQRMRSIKGAGKRQVDFYENIGPDKYLTEVRRFVPVYDDVVKIVVDTLIRHRPNRILDVGSGMGNVDEEILERSEARVTCVDASERMTTESRLRLRRFGDRATVICQPIEEFTFDTRYDAIISILALHNLASENKLEVLNRMLAHLESEAPFIWADLIRHTDPGIHRHLMEIRRKHAERHGASFEFIEENFRKEDERDSKLTIPETLQLCTQVGFENIDVIWAAGTVGVFHMSKQRQ